MTTRSGRDRKLEALRRWRRLDLDAARTRHAAAEKRAADERRAAARVEEHLVEAQEIRRSLLDARERLEPDTLRALERYMSWQAQQLRQRIEDVRKAECDAEKSRDEVRHRWRDARVLEKVQERRERDTAREAARKNDNDLDDRGAAALHRARQTKE